MLFLFQNLITVYSLYFLQILLSVLMTANLWHKAQAQINPVISTVLGNGNGFAFFSVPQNPQTFLVPVAGVTGVNPGVAGGITGAGGLAVSTILNYVEVRLSLCTPCRRTGEMEVQLNSFLNSVPDRDE